MRRSSTPTILKAQRTSPRKYNTHHTGAQLRGLRYQRAVGRSLTKSLKGVGAIITSEPWFEYISRDNSGLCVCAPDFLIEYESFTIVVEVKLTFVHSAVEKLLGIYVPVVNCALLRDGCCPLVITKTLTPSAPLTITRISQALGAKEVPVLQWLGRGSPISW